MKKINLRGLTVDEILGIIEPEGYNSCQALKLANAIYKKRVTDISLMASVPRALKEFLAQVSGIEPLTAVSAEVSVDRTIKYQFAGQGGKRFETVFIPGGKRNTICVSVQSGCRMGCSFCLTAGYGFRGNLETSDILNQVLSIPFSGKVTHVVFMGMGEPMDNLGNVLKACEILTATWGVSMSPRNITVSSVGITPGVKTFLERSACNLAISLYSPFPAERSDAVPVQKIYPVDEIIEIMKCFPVRRQRRLSVAYIMIEGVNDTDEHLSALKSMLAGSRIRVNLLPFNQTGRDLRKSSGMERIELFRHDLVINGISASIRKSRGADISAACGLLASGLRDRGDNNILSDSRY